MFQSIAGLLGSHLRFKKLHILRSQILYNVFIDFNASYKTSVIDYVGVSIELRNV